MKYFQLTNTCYNMIIFACIYTKLNIKIYQTITKNEEQSKEVNLVNNFVIDSYLLPSFQNVKRVVRCFFTGYQYLFVQSSVNLKESRASIFLNHLEDDQTSQYTIQILSFSIQDILKGIQANCIQFYKYEDENNISNHVYFQDNNQYTQIEQKSYLDCTQQPEQDYTQAFQINFPKLESSQTDYKDFFIGYTGFDVDQTKLPTRIRLEVKSYISNQLNIDLVSWSSVRIYSFKSTALMLVFKKFQNGLIQNSFTKECIQICQDGYFKNKYFSKAPFGTYCDFQKLCFQCIVNDCQQCYQSLKICLKCSQNDYFLDGNCFCQQPEGAFCSIPNKTCQKCINENCQQSFSDLKSCSMCRKGFYSYIK
ncbi:hypothetical protein ABPG72_004468 [Tetrahymena utriculariae]